MQRRAGRGEQLTAASEVEAVVGVAPVGRAAAHRHQPARAELAEVVGDETLRSPEQAGELADLAVAAGQLIQQPPSQWMPGELQKARRGEIHARARYIKQAQSIKQS